MLRVQEKMCCCKCTPARLLIDRHLARMHTRPPAALLATEQGCLAARTHTLMHMHTHVLLWPPACPLPAFTACAQQHAHHDRQQAHRLRGPPACISDHAAPLLPPPPRGRTSMNSRWSSRRLSERRSLLRSASVTRGAGWYLQ